MLGLILPQTAIVFFFKLSPSIKKYIHLTTIKTFYTRAGFQKNYREWRNFITTITSNQ